MFPAVFVGLTIVSLVINRTIAKYKNRSLLKEVAIMDTANHNDDNAPVLDWTGHPLVDVGIATLCAMANKDDPRKLTLNDLDHAADEMAEYYFSGLMTSYNSCVFTMNAYDNATSSPKTKKEYEYKVLRAHRSDGDEGAKGLICPFSGKPATHLIERRQMPMLTGENVLNFYPSLRGALPIAGPYLTALQALPLGGRRVEGKLLIAHSDFPPLTVDFAMKYLHDNRRLLGALRNNSLPQQDGPSSILYRELAVWDSKKKQPKYPDAKSAGSLIASDLMELWSNRQEPFVKNHPVSITAYWLSNSGQGPSLDVFHLPSQLIRFLSLANLASYNRYWKELIAKGWQKPVGSGDNVPGGPGRSRNSVLADLFDIFTDIPLNLQAAKTFLRRHLLRASPQRLLSADNNMDYQGRLNRPELVCWPLTELFLEEVIGLDPRHIQSIKNFADTLASHIEQTNDRSLFQQIVYSRYPWELRNALTKAQRNQAKTKNQLLFGLDEYLEVFEAEDLVGKSDWSLTRDLISIRLVEQLYKNQWFEKDDNKELLDDPDNEEAS